MTPANPDYNLLIAIYVAVVILYFCVQELFLTHMFSEEEKKQLQENKKNAQKD